MCSIRLTSIGSGTVQSFGSHERIYAFNLTTALIYGDIYGKLGHSYNGMIQFRKTQAINQKFQLYGDPAEAGRSQ